MSAATELLQRLSEIGADVEPAGNKLVLRAGARPVPAELVRQLRAEKTRVLALLATPPQVRDEAWWRREFAARTVRWLIGTRTVAEAERLAFNQLAAEWHEQHAERVPGWRCAGCGASIGERSAFDLSDGNRVHFDRLECLIQYGDRWRNEARQALMAMGLVAPADEDAPS